MINVTWDDVKQFSSQRSVGIHYIVANSSYYIWSFDYPLWVTCQIPIESPASVNQIDFETNYQTNANKVFANKLVGDSTNIKIGNVGDRLKVDALISNTSPISVSSLKSNIFYQNELAINTRNESDISGTTYTVPGGKIFSLTNLIATADSSSASYIIRLKKQTGGSGSFNQILKITLEIGGQGQSTVPLAFTNGLLIGAAGDVFKLTVEATVAKGTIWSGFSGIES